ncbi:aberrant lateral root formation 4 [Striga hermonthica]|uniref:Aberrant lateral root formation 4 n=1 Tax=Striga hermonthica TaxID=68872 RepID=A0A9N7NYB0_STRHE|nr:aberrant lateral root formation 4 [Striga hermonthica]
MLDDTSALVATLHENLACCSKLIEASDYTNSEQSIAELVDFLDSLSNSLISEGRQNDASEKTAIEILTQIHQYMASPEVKQDIVDALAFELPKAAARFACVSTRCSEVAEGVVDLFVSRCSPRDMLSIICEAIGSPSEHFMVPGYFVPLLNGLMKVLALIQRRHYEHVKTTVPVVLNVLRIICSEPDYEDTDYEKVFHKAAGIACSIRAIFAKLEDRDSKKLNAILGLYVLEIMVLVSVGMSSDISRCLPVVLELSDTLQYCELSYIGLITGFEVDTINKLVVGEITDDIVDAMDCFSQGKLGAAVAVMWGYKASKVAAAARADLAAVTVELQSNWRRRWEAIGMLRYIFLCANLSWELKQDSMTFLLSIMDGIVSNSEDEDVDFSMHIPTFCTSLQAIQMVIMYAPGSALRKNAFSAFKKVLADIPTSERMDILRALIKNSDSPSMIGILLNCVKDEMHMGKFERDLSANAVPNVDITRSTLLWNPSVLELVEEVLRPPVGGPPPFPEYSDAILSALNLFRYILITESTGKYSIHRCTSFGNSNYTGIVSKENLHKAYNEWLLPLRTLVTFTAAESQKDHDDLLACDMMCALNPIQLVLYRCIELVEENLQKL